MGSEYLHDYNPICNYINVHNQEKEEMKLICKKYLRFLNTSKSWGEANSSYNVSLLLNYWLYDKLTQIYRDTRSNLIYVGFGALQLIWSRFKPSRSEEEYYKKCKPELDMVNHTDWKNRKDLYDYCINSELISLTCPFYGDKCLEYCDYIEKKRDIYNHFESICSKEEENCPQFYRKCEKYNPKTMLNTLKCHERAKAKEKITMGDGDMNHLPGQKVEAAASALGTEETNETSGIGIKVTNSYTPFGSWIRKFRGGNINSVGTIDVVPSYMQETGDIFSDNDANYISYQPM
ncbi:variable surface protein Vir4/32-like [Plasmodium vivax]|uniref:Variable surface protein Vir4/32-like n=1 Tax=Plasmodium vivax (strain Salvador I) TaxID=126793 RepID=A5KCV0_PLAVS|nr:variable surface protein Vir4/32-like [Plasmodium vivax]EDL42818.1 variable surface protein Vir4/32-like [Plasmodium vivax]|eukprot:XP_001612605.1 variable surface protein Vir4/32-like [Plasmodium vivax Sal-1]